MGQAHQFAAALAASLRQTVAEEEDELDFQDEEREDRRKPAPVGTTVEALWADSPEKLDEPNCMFCGSKDMHPDPTEHGKKNDWGGYGYICGACGQKSNKRSPIKTRGKFRRRIMKQRPLPTVTSAGYYICGPTGSPMSGPYAGPSEALAALTKQGGAMVQYKSAQSEDPDWAISKPRPFPYGSNTVTGASVTTPQDYCESCRTPMTQGEIDRAYKDHGRMVCDSCSNAGTVDSKTAMPACTYRCESCRHTFNHRDQHAYCPNCNSFLVDKNASVTKIEYDEDGNLLPPAYRLATVATTNLPCGCRSVLEHVDCTEPMGHKGKHRFDKGEGDILEWDGVGQEGDPYRMNE